MRAHGFAFWLVLFVVGSLLWLWPAPWAEVMGKLIVFVAVFIGVTAPTWRINARFRKPRYVVALQFANLLPMFVLGWSLPWAEPSTAVRIVYLVVAAIVLAVNSYAVLSRHDESAA
jgi:hypothetical protein